MAIDSTTLRTLRAVLFGGIAAALVGTLGRAQPASAHDPDDVRLGAVNSTPYSTIITSTGTDGEGFRGNAGPGGIGLVGISDSGIGVFGESGSRDAIHGHSESGHAVYGRSQGDGVSSVYGVKDAGKGPSILGENKVLTNGYAAIYGLTNGSGPGLLGENTEAGNGASGVARGTGSGVYGQSDNGRGGTFVGKKAQLRLQPTAAASHPASGQAGDLYVDSQHRLWFCKGGTTWKQLA